MGSSAVECTLLGKESRAFRVFSACCLALCEESKPFLCSDFNWALHEEMALNRTVRGDTGLPPGLGSQIAFVRYVGPMANCFLDYFINEWGEAHLIFPQVGITHHFNRLGRCDS